METLIDSAALNKINEREAKSSMALAFLDMSRSRMLA